MSMSDERMLQVNGVELCVQTFGDAADPAILLIMGAAASMDHWPEGFCRRLADGGRYVIRYDHRDTGRSTSYEPGKPTYTFSDLVSDAAGVLDALGIERAHMAGMSMGGAIAQTLAIAYPARLASLTLMSTSAIESTGRELPSMSDELRAGFDSPPPEPDWADRAAVVDYLVEGERPYEHGEALADLLPDARVVALEGVGHEAPPEPVWDVAVPAVLDHTAGDSATE
jgi:pimeloyl-ACP methyl ester carboxylesterase